ncbi:MAG: V-type ATP synthase subunit I [Oscillospiraceae bacterium]
MGIVKMSQLTVEGSADRLDAAMMICCESGAFHITDMNDGSLRGIGELNPYESTYKGMCDLAHSLGITLKELDYSSVTQQTPEDFEEYFNSFSQTVTKMKKDCDDLLSVLEEHKQTDNYLNHLTGLNVSFNDLFNMRYIKAKIGKLPSENLKKLSYYNNKCMHFIPFDDNGEYVWGLYLTARKTAEFCDRVMNSLFFEHIRLPDYLVDNVESSDKLLKKIILDEEELTRELKVKLNEFIKENEAEFLGVLSKLSKLNGSFELRKKAFISNDSFTFSGYCPTKKCAELTDKLSAAGASVNAIPIKGGSDAADVPVKLKNNFLFRPFEMFVKMYGLPEYGTFDPTPYVAVTYMLMFGIMFGDVGQGLAISAIGLLLTKLTSNGLAPIMTRIGLFSAAFGVLYGSVFGIETIIEPFFHRENIWRLLGYTERPENIFQVATVLLIAALCIGILLIVISMTFNTVLNFRKKKWGDALFSVNGVSGLVFYISLVAAAACMFTLKINLFTPVYIICLIVVPLLLIFFKHPLSDLISGVKSSEKLSVGNFIIENFIDLFEAALSFLSNTMSFLRIGGFVLSHAGMMLVVAQLAGTNVPDAKLTVGTIITYIIGNLIVMGVEGLLVGIQILRLEFYEIFNRFYSGSGQRFQPVEITFSTDI